MTEKERKGIIKAAREIKRIAKIAKETRKEKGIKFDSTEELRKRRYATARS